MESPALDSEVLLENAQDSFRWAGFWIRVLASIVDVIVFLPLVALNFYNVLSLKSIWLMIAVAIISVAYKPLMEFKYGATVGKMVLKLKVVDASSNRLSFSQAIVRYIPWIPNYVLSAYGTMLLVQHQEYSDVSNWAETMQLQQSVVDPNLSMISGAIIFVSCIVVAFTKKKQGIHDLIAKTYCVYKDA